MKTISMNITLRIEWLFEKINSVYASFYRHPPILLHEDSVATENKTPFFSFVSHSHNATTLLYLVLNGSVARIIQYVCYFVFLSTEKNLWKDIFAALWSDSNRSRIQLLFVLKKILFLSDFGMLFMSFQRCDGLGIRICCFFCSFYWLLEGAELFHLDLDLFWDCALLLQANRGPRRNAYIPIFNYWTFYFERSQYLTDSKRQISGYKTKSNHEFADFMKERKNCKISVLIRS